MSASESAAGSRAACRWRSRCRGRSRTPWGLRDAPGVGQFPIKHLVTLLAGDRRRQPRPVRQGGQADSNGVEHAEEPTSSDASDGDAMTTAWMPTPTEKAMSRVPSWKPISNPLSTAAIRPPSTSSGAGIDRRAVEPGLEGAVHDVHADPASRVVRGDGGVRGHGPARVWLLRPCTPSAPSAERSSVNSPAASKS